MKKNKLILIFIATSILWIFGTNYLVDHFAPLPFSQMIENGKELFYVIVTGCFFYFYITKSEELSVSQQEGRRLSTLINSMVDVVIFKDGEGRWIEANKYGLELLQLENVDYRGKQDSELAQYTEFYGNILRECVMSDEEVWNKRTISRMEEILPTPDGSKKTFDSIKVPLFDSDGSRKGFVIIGRDISDRIQVKTMLKESEQRYRSLFDYNPDIVYMIDLNGFITNLNPQFHAITGHDAEEAIGKHITDLVSPRLRKKLLTMLDTVITDQKPHSFDMNVWHKNGEKLTLECVSVPMVINGEISGIIGYGKDITQIRETEERLRRTEKLSVVGELSASVAHEIRNPLTSIKGFVQLLKMEDEKHQRYYKIMIDELDRINQIIGELLLLAKPQQLKYRKSNIHTILSDVVSLLSTEASMHNIEIEFICTQTELEMECEPNQLKQLFINIIKNAIEASNEGGLVTVSLIKVGQENISIVVKDSGCGISKERLKRLGEPFYSSKEKGTGLGLTVSFNIVQSHHGKIHFHSENHSGTEVLMEFPINCKHESPQTVEVEYAQSTTHD